MLLSLLLAGCTGALEHDSTPLAANRLPLLASGFTGPLTVNDDPVLAPQSDGTVVFSTWANTASWNPVTNEWTARARPPATNSSTSRAALTNGKVMRAGGGAPGFATAQLYDPATNTWLQSTLNEPRNRASLAALPNGSALVAGGVGAGTTAERYNVATNSWTMLGALDASGNTLLLRDGRVLFVEGLSLFDPASDLRWQLSPGTVSAEAAVQLVDGSVLVVGRNAWYLLDVDALTWLATGPVQSRVGFALVLLTDGRVLRIGGNAGGVEFSTSEVFSPRTRTWAPGPSLLQARSRSAAVAVAPGFVLVAGGFVASASVPPERGAELVDVGCVPTSCSDNGFTCGSVPDGCGGTLDCGSCPSGVCSQNRCVSCVAATCASLGANCGSASDGCGGTLSCGTCGTAQTCAANRCVTTPGPAQNATWSSTSQIPLCATAGRSCDTGPLVVGRAGLSEPNAPNTLNGGCADGAAGTFHVSPSLDRVVVRSGAGTWLGDGPIQLEATVWVSSLSERLDVFVLSVSGTWNLVATVAPTALGQQVLTTSFQLPTPTPTTVRTQYRASATAVSCATGASDDRDDLAFMVRLPDTTPPYAWFTAPTMGATVRGVVSVSGVVIDSQSATTTQVFDGQTLLFSSTGSSMAGTWNTLSVSQGLHHLFARSTDAVGNSFTTLNLLVNVDNAPLLSISAPAPGATLAGDALFSATASAVTGRTLSGVEFFVDGLSVGTASAEPWSMNWNSRLVSNGTHTVTARATDSGGLTTTSTAVTFTVANDCSTAADGTGCDDGNACTRTDTCHAGACVGSNLVVCMAQDQCHLAGTCDPATGGCSTPAAPDGTACGDGNACTRTDTCQAGTCVGSNLVVCVAQDQCHLAGTCDPATGGCSTPAAPDGTACGDGNACTRTDT
ncbi:MAG: Ig-like domain-containing protein, partial [Myxococcota bacterium]